MQSSPGKKNLSQHQTFAFKGMRGWGLQGQAGEQDRGLQEWVSYLGTVGTALSPS